MNLEGVSSLNMALLMRRTRAEPCSGSRTTLFSKPMMSELILYGHNQEKGLYVYLHLSCYSLSLSQTYFLLYFDAAVSTYSCLSSVRQLGPRSLDRRMPRSRSIRSSKSFPCTSLHEKNAGWVLIRNTPPGER